MLTLTNAPAVKDISTLNLGVAAVAADARAFRRGDAVSLLKVNGTLTTAAELKNTGDAQTMKATQSGILDYTMRLEKRGENELIATVDRVDVNDRSKSPVETSRICCSTKLIRLSFPRCRKHRTAYIRQSRRVLPAVPPLFHTPAADIAWKSPYPNAPTEGNHPYSTSV